MIVDHSQSSSRMPSVEEVATAVRQGAAHEVRIEMLTARIDEMRDNLDQAGLRLQAADSQIQSERKHEWIREVHAQQGDDA